MSSAEEILHEAEIGLAHIADEALRGYRKLIEEALPALLQEEADIEQRFAILRQRAGQLKDAVSEARACIVEGFASAPEAAPPASLLELLSLLELDLGLLAKLRSRRGIRMALPAFTSGRELEALEQAGAHSWIEARLAQTPIAGA
jgi:cell division septum initiation protein DivIVA